MNKQSYHCKYSIVNQRICLSDGTVLEKLVEDVFIITGPTSLKLEISPAPCWTIMTSDALEYIEKFGNLWKLSKEKDLFGNEKWQDRHFVLSRDILYYYGSSSEREPRGVIPLVYGAIALKNKGEPRRIDAFIHGLSENCLTTIATGSEGEFDGVVSRRSIALHKPVSPIPLKNSYKHKNNMNSCARTYYMTCESDSELQEWLQAIDNNIQIVSAEKSIDLFIRFILQVGGSVDGVNLPYVLNRLYSHD